LIRPTVEKRVREFRGGEVAFVDLREQELRTGFREQSAKLIANLVDAGKAQRISVQFRLAHDREALCNHWRGDGFEDRRRNESSRPEFRLIGIEEVVPGIAAFVGVGDEILAEGLWRPQEWGPLGGSRAAVAFLVFLPRPTGTRSVHWELLTHDDVAS
jgi:hypothetical protein